MNQSLQRYRFLPWIKWSGLLALLLALCTCAQAQLDTLPYTGEADSVGVSVQAPDEEYDDEEEETEREYFAPTDSLNRLRLIGAARLRKVPDTLVKNLKQEDAFWYADQAFNFKKDKVKKRGTTVSPLLETLLWIFIIAAFAAVIILYLSNSNVGIFRSSRRIRDAETEEDELEDIFAINYQKEIDKAVNTGNYRLAVRLLFLRLLRNLSDKKIIEYAQDRTNFDYLLQLRSSSRYEDFFRLTRNYEYSWYGQFEVDANAYALIRKEFENFDHKL